MASLKDRSTLTLKDFRGVDYSSSPFSAASFRSTESRNMILENGVLHKRPGWRQIRDLNHIKVYDTEGTEKKWTSKIINGMHYLPPITLDDDTCVSRGWIVHMEKKLIYIPDGDDNDEHTICYQADVTNAPSSFMEKENKVYIFCGDVIVFGQFQETSGYEFKRFVDLDDFYIPTTTININCVTENDENIALLEPPSLLTPWRKNTLVPRSNTCDVHTEYTGTDPIGNWGYFSWELDGAIEYKSEVTITCGDHTYIVVDNKNFSDRASGKIHIVEKELYTDGQYGPSYRGWIAYGSQKGVPLRMNAHINMWFDDCSHDESAMATVTFKCVIQDENQYEKNKELITKCTVATLFGAEGNTNRLFLSGNPDCPNRIFYSGYRQFDYFSDANYVTAGKESSSVIGFLRMSDNTVAVLKEPSKDDFSIFYMTGELQNKYDSLGNLESGKAIFYVHNGGTGTPCINGRSAANLLGDSIMLTHEGVVGITIPSDSTTKERFVKERSYSIGAHKINNLSSGHGIVYRGRYYLAINDEEDSCFVADPKHRYYRDGNDVDQSYNYEWWHWDHVPARVWYVTEDIAFIPCDLENETSEITTLHGNGIVDVSQLCFGTTDGRICAFDINSSIGNEVLSKIQYADRTYHAIDEGSFALNIPSNTVIYADELKGLIKEGDILSINSQYLHASIVEGISPADQDGYYTVGAEDIVKLKDGMKLKAYVEETEEHISVTISGVDLALCRFKMDLTPNGAFSLWKSLQNVPLYAVNVTPSTFQLKAGKTEDVLCLCEYDETGSYTAMLTKAAPVKARWITPYFDLGSNLYGKTMLAMSLTAPVGSKGLRFGYQTKRRNDMVENQIALRGSEALSFGEFSFLPNEFTLDNDFPASHTVRTNVRNFNYIRFCFVSDKDSDCAVNSLTVLYKINRMNKGVR